MQATAPGFVPASPADLQASDQASDQASHGAAARAAAEPATQAATQATVRGTAQDDWAPGTHLVSPRRGYQHHGLYAGEGRVIHYAGFNRLFRRGPVEEVSLARFARGRGVHAHAHATPAFAGTTAVARARARLGENRYRFWTNNCEHFVQWALNGTPRSSQVERWVQGWRRTWSRMAWAVLPVAR